MWPSGYGAKLVIQWSGFKLSTLLLTGVVFWFAALCKLPNGSPPTSKDFCTMFIYNVCFN